MHPGHTPYLNSDDWGGLIMGNPSWMTSKTYPEFSKWPKAECYFNTRYVYAHSEFTPQQTMRGKMAIYGYLYGLGKTEKVTQIVKRGKPRPAAADQILFSIKGNQLELPKPGDYHVSVLDISGRVLWSKAVHVKSSMRVVPATGGTGLRIISVQGKVGAVSRTVMKF
jgi:hypothetical protein